MMRLDNALRVESIRRNPARSRARVKTRVRVEARVVE